MDVDEFYHEVEEESDYYLDLLKEDSIQEVDYQMMVETAEIEKIQLRTPGNSLKTGRPKRSVSQRKRKRGCQAGKGAKCEARR